MSTAGCPRGPVRAAVQVAHGRVGHAFYPGRRHEPCNDLDRGQAIRDLIAWLDRTAAQG